MVNINSIEGIESLIDKRTKPLKEEILKLRFELEELKQALTIHVVVVPKGTLCECKKHSLKTNYGFEVCTKCGNEFDDQHNALQR